MKEKELLTKIMKMFIKVIQWVKLNYKKLNIKFLNKNHIPKKSTKIIKVINKICTIMKFKDNLLHYSLKRFLPILKELNLLEKDSAISKTKILKGSKEILAQFYKT
jgi:hypothetical protein